MKNPFQIECSENAKAIICFKLLVVVIIVDGTKLAQFKVNCNFD